tara:strand:+ start:295 stop:570 length:276 start_codon:yes stop_codon:yes gene_type:complete
MCGCDENVVDLQKYKIYTIMAEYKAKLSSGTTYKDGYKIKWKNATQEELAHAYEIIGLTSLIEKLEKTNTLKQDGEKASKKSGKSKDKKSD